MIVDIFIKTYHKDFIWLKYCLASIKKFAKGFRKVVIVSDNDGHVIPDKFLEGLLVDIHYTSIPKIQPSHSSHGIGYLWQQIVKLSWHTYTDADAVLILDSDWMFTVPTTPEDFMTDGKFKWLYREWEKAGTAICWKESTEFLLKTPTNYEAMAVAGFLMTRDTTIAFKDFICNTHGTKTIWEIILKYDLSSFSEFNLYGSYVILFNRPDYVAVYNDAVHTLHNKTILTSWSWGGLTNEDKLIRENILLS